MLMMMVMQNMMTPIYMYYQLPAKFILEVKMNVFTVSDTPGARATLHRRWTKRARCYIASREFSHLSLFLVRRIE